MARVVTPGTCKFKNWTTIIVKNRGEYAHTLHSIRKLTVEDAQVDIFQQHGDAVTRWQTAAGAEVEALVSFILIIIGIQDTIIRRFWWGFFVFGRTQCPPALHYCRSYRSRGHIELNYRLNYRLRGQRLTFPSTPSQVYQQARLQDEVA